MTPAEMAKYIHGVLEKGKMSEEEEYTWDELEFTKPVVNTISITNVISEEQFLVNIKKVNK